MTLKESIEHFLFAEADLLDRWQLDDWEALLTDDAQYLVPPLGTSELEGLSPDTTLYVVADDRAMLAARVERLTGKTAYCESPRSSLRHLIGNVRILGDTGDELTVAANFCVYRIRRAEVTQYIGQYRYRLLRSGTGFRIRNKSVILDIDVLRGQGGLGIIL